MKTIKLKIDHQEVEVPEGTSVMRAAQSLGIVIPSMCFLNEEFSNHPSCMVCMVKDLSSDKLFPSCAMPALENMNIETASEEVHKARKEALELLLSDHVGDCEAPCTLTCPAGMDIPHMNRLIAEGEFSKAIKIVKEHIALPLAMGYVCPAPCENACRRKDKDAAVSICELKKFVAHFDYMQDKAYFPDKQSSSGKNVAIIGAGPAGLSAGFYTLINGHNCTVYDLNNEIGGSLISETTEADLPRSEFKKEIDFLKDFGMKMKTSIKIDATNFKSLLLENYDAIVLATGKNSKETIDEWFNEKFVLNSSNYSTSIEKVFACGSIVKNNKMAIRAMAQGKECAYAVNAFLIGKNKNKASVFNSRFGKLKTSEIEEYMKECEPWDRVMLRKGDSSFRPGQAIKEAERCMRCDCRKPTSCKLRLYATEYKAERTKFNYGERNEIVKDILHDELIYEQEKCIRCNLCVEITSKYGETLGITSIGRGFDLRMRTPFNLSIKEAVEKCAIEVVHACPTGALAFKNTIK